MPTEKPRFTITVDKELFGQIEEFKFINRYKNQTKAVIALIEKGLDVLASKDPEIADAVRKKPATYLKADEEKLVNLYRALNEEGQERLLESAEVMVDSKRYKKGCAVSLDKEA